MPEVWGEMSTLERFTISNRVEGFISAHPSLPEALTVAQRHKYPQTIEVFDVMAQRGRPDTWDYKGNVLSVRPERR